MTVHTLDSPVQKTVRLNLARTTTSNTGVNININSDVVITPPPPRAVQEGVRPQMQEQIQRRIQ